MLQFEINFNGASDCFFSYSVKINGAIPDENSNPDIQREWRKMAAQEIGYITRSLVGQLQLTGVRVQKQNPSTE